MMRLWRCVAVVAVVAVTWASPRGGRADTGEGTALHWVRAEGAEQCIAPGALARAIQARLGREVFSAAADAQLAVEGHVAPAKGGGFRVLIRVTDDSGIVLGSRQVDSPGDDCRQLDEAVVLIVAVTLYPQTGLTGAGISLPADVQTRLDDALGRLDEAIEAGETSEPVQRPPARGTRRGPRKRATSPAKRQVLGPAEPLQWSLGIDGGGIVGLTPSASATVAVHLDLQPPEFVRMETNVVFVIPSSTDVAVAGAVASVDTVGALLGAGVCNRRDRAVSLAAVVCAGVQAGALFVQGVGFAQAHDSVAGLVGPYAKLAMELSLSEHFSLHAGAELAGMLVRPKLVFQTVTSQEETVFLASPANVRGFGGLLWVGP